MPTDFGFKQIETLLFCFWNFISYKRCNKCCINVAQIRKKFHRIHTRRLHSRAIIYPSCYNIWFDIKLKNNSLLLKRNILLNISDIFNEARGERARVCAQKVKRGVCLTESITFFRAYSHLCEPFSSIFDFDHQSIFEYSIEVFPPAYLVSSLNMNIPLFHTIICDFYSAEGILQLLNPS